MINILLSALFSIFIANILRYNNSGKENSYSMYAGNYLIASIIALFYITDTSHFNLNHDVILSVIAGAFFLINLFIYNKSLVANGVSLSVSVMRISVIIPVVLSLIFFKESINIYTFFGIILTILVIVLLSKIQNKASLIYIILLFSVTGFTDFTFRIHRNLNIISDAMFLFLIFFSALIITLFMMFSQKTGFNKKSFINGLILGFPNFYTSFFFVKALNDLPAVICYPVNSSLIILGSFLSDLLIWKNRFKWYQYLLYFCLIIAVVILNIGLATKD
jgi:drug/metabolite transporter (DMT)-like permease